MVIWKNNLAALFARLDDEIGGMNCTKYENEYSAILPPDWLSEICEFWDLDAVEGKLANLFKCQIGPVKFKIWVQNNLNIPLKAKIIYPNGVKVVALWEHFHEVTKFDDDCFIPPTGWQCPRF